MSIADIQPPARHLFWGTTKPRQETVITVIPCLGGVVIQINPNDGHIAQASQQVHPAVCLVIHQVSKRIKQSNNQTNNYFSIWGRKSERARVTVRGKGPEEDTRRMDGFIHVLSGSYASPSTINPSPAQFLSRFQLLFSQIQPQSMSNLT